MKKTIISRKVDIQISDKLKAKCERNGQTVSEVIAQFAENYIFPLYFIRLLVGIPKKIATSKMPINQTV